MKIIEKGLSLFAEKGYHSTTIQEIADKAGISKGSFYVYFSSKEDFMITAFSYFHIQMTERMQQVADENLAPRPSLAKQITAMMDYIYTYRDFIIMYMRENISIGIGEKMDTLLTDIKQQSCTWLEKNIKNIYGDRVNSFMVDAIAMLEGLIQSYIKWLIMDNVLVDQKRIGSFLVNRFDDLIEGMIAHQEKPLIRTKNKYNQSNAYYDLINVMDQKVRAFSDKQTARRLQEVLAALRVEVAKEARQNIFIQGLLAHFQQHEELKEDCKRMADLLDVDLLS